MHRIVPENEHWKNGFWPERIIFWFIYSNSVKMKIWLDQKLKGEFEKCLRHWFFFLLTWKQNEFMNIIHCLKVTDEGKNLNISNENCEVVAARAIIFKFPKSFFNGTTQNLASIPVFQMTFVWKFLKNMCTEGLAWLRLWRNWHYQPWATLDTKSKDLKWATAIQFHGWKRILWMMPGNPSQKRTLNTIRSDFTCELPWKQKWKAGLIPNRQWRMN